MTDRLIGQIEAKVDALQEDVAYIRDHMVTRREFETAKAEHAPLEKRLLAMELAQAESSVIRRWLDRLLWAAIAAGTAMILGVKI